MPTTCRAALLIGCAVSASCSGDAPSVRPDAPSATTTAAPSECPACGERETEFLALLPEVRPALLASFRSPDDPLPSAEAALALYASRRTFRLKERAAGIRDAKRAAREADALWRLLFQRMHAGLVALDAKEPNRSQLQSLADSAEFGDSATPIDATLERVAASVAGVTRALRLAADPATRADALQSWDATVKRYDLATFKPEPVAIASIRSTLPNLLQAQAIAHREAGRTVAAALAFIAAADARNDPPGKARPVPFTVNDDDAWRAQAAALLSPWFAANVPALSGDATALSSGPDDTQPWSGFVAGAKTQLVPGPATTAPPMSITLGPVDATDVTLSEEREKKTITRTRWIVREDPIVAWIDDRLVALDRLEAALVKLDAEHFTIVHLPRFHETVVKGPDGRWKVADVTEEALTFQLNLTMEDRRQSGEVRLRINAERAYLKETLERIPGQRVKVTETVPLEDIRQRFHGTCRRTATVEWKGVRTPIDAGLDADFGVRRLYYNDDGHPDDNRLATTDLPTACDAATRKALRKRLPALVAEQLRNAADASDADAKPLLAAP